NGKISALSSIFMKDSGLTYSCQNNTIAMIKINADFFKKLSYLFLIIATLFALFSIAMFANFITVSIRNKYNEIGILRALGARSVEILKMFVVESIALALINAIVASIVGAFGCVFINFFLSKYLNFYIPIALFGIRQVLVIFGLSLLVAVISATRPIVKISKKKPVEIISRSL
ncbi:MAG: FtsX-like permease family protein, partial [Firmicutes bacterium]|nr:FtsX-like permease family protein [Bacillota bacterium]